MKILNQVSGSIWTSVWVKKLDSFHKECTLFTKDETHELVRHYRAVRKSTKFWWILLGDPQFAKPKSFSLWTNQKAPDLSFFSSFKLQFVPANEFAPPADKLCPIHELLGLALRHGRIDEVRPELHYDRHLREASEGETWKDRSERAVWDSHTESWLEGAVWKEQFGKRAGGSLKFSPGKRTKQVLWRWEVLIESAFRSTGEVWCNFSSACKQDTCELFNETIRQKSCIDEAI